MKKEKNEAIPLGIDQELDALCTVFYVLKPLNWAARERILNYVSKRL